MEEIREAAMARYENLSEVQKAEVRDLFTKMDSDGDGKVSLQEYLDHPKKDGYDQEMFELVDNDGDGYWDFDEFKTFEFIYKVRGFLICECCSCYLWGTYYACLTCYDAGNDAFGYNLCCSCYRNKSFQHDHTDFRDNHGICQLRRPKRKPSQTVCEKPPSSRLDPVYARGVQAQAKVGTGQQSNSLGPPHPSFSPSGSPFLHFHEVVEQAQMVHKLEAEQQSKVGTTIEGCRSSTQQQSKGNPVKPINSAKPQTIIKKGQREMEEMRDAAMAYYENLTKQQKLLARVLFRMSDTNGDGTVNVQEYLNFLKEQNFSAYVPPNLFKLLDKNGDGTMDFEEFVTLYYIVKVRCGIINCDGCDGSLFGLYFTCVECYLASGRTYDLCCKCYHNKNFKHQHSTFLDSCALLNLMKPTKSNPTQGNTSRAVQGRRSNSQMELKEAFDAFEKGLRLPGTVCNAVDALVTVSGFCNTM